MKKLLGTLKSLFNANARKVNRALQVSNCIDLVGEQQYKMAKGYKKLVVAINDLKAKLDETRTKAESEENPSVKAILSKQVEIIESTLTRITANKEKIGNKIKKMEDSRVVLTAKKTLLDSIEDLKSTTSNVFESQDFNVDEIMAEIDKSIRDIESEFQADDELNELVK